MTYWNRKQIHGSIKLNLGNVAHLCQRKHVPQMTSSQLSQQCFENASILFIHFPNCFGLQYLCVCVCVFPPWKIHSWYAFLSSFDQIDSK